MRDRLIRTIVLLGVALVAITEVLSAVGAIRRGWLIVCWAVVAALIVVWWRRQRRSVNLSRDFVVWICLAGAATVLILTAIAASFSAPNSADAMAYHLPRVVYWAEQSSVRFFPTPYVPQIMLQPLAEYGSLHLFVITGGDSLTNFIQWFASLGCVITVSAIAKEFGASVRGQAMAGLFCATIPSGILASSGAKNDYALAMWLCAMVYFALTRQLVWMGAALGLALLTKATAYLFAPWLLIAILAFRFRRELIRGAAVAAVVALSINATHFARNIALSGSPLGFPSAQGDDGYRWRNDFLGWKPTASNLLRNTSDQLGARSESWNQAVFRVVLRAHERLGIDVNDRATTWPDSVFAAPKNANHEADAPNRWHLLLTILATGVLIWTRKWPAVFFVAALACGFLSFCAYLKWQPFQARLLLPLFVLASPVIGLAAEKLRFSIVQIALCLFLLMNARLPALQNWTRPLQGPRSVFHTARDEQYFNDLGQFGNRANYDRAVELIATSSCRIVGIDINTNQLEYPLQALLRRRIPDVKFLHSNVRNISYRYSPPVRETPCAVVCIDCGDDRLVTFSH